MKISNVKLTSNSSYTLSLIHISLQQAADSLDNQIQIYNNLSDYLAFDSDLNESANRIYTNYMELYDAYSKDVYKRQCKRRFVAA